jgi:hypothetical protein
MTPEETQRKLQESLWTLLLLMSQSGQKNLTTLIDMEGTLYFLSVNSVPLSVVQNYKPQSKRVTLSDGTVPPDTRSYQCCESLLPSGYLCLKPRGHAGPCA